MNAAKKTEQSAIAKSEPTVLATIAAWLSQVLNPGERYAGVVLGADGMPSHHLVLMAGAASDVSWAAAKAWAEQVGGELPTRQEQALLFANLKGEFEQRAYWSGEQHAAYADYAWFQDFVNGYQDDITKSASLRARAVRRLFIS